MCEWLSCREWCDVELLCGGRSLPAHRTVLASVSAFLRRILLSRPPEETPTFIVLPGFDFDAMTSVLYYIYNGEVVVQKHKLEMFMDIVKAMEIFVDKQCLSAASNKEALCVNVCNRNMIDRSNIFTLGDRTDGQLINLRKGDAIKDNFIKYCSNDTKNLDKEMKFQNLNMQACFGNVQSAYGDRQRSSFLRDLFIETYPRNGNANGRAAGVPAIPSECYRAAASVLLTNANSDDLRADERISELQEHTTALSQSINELQPLNLQQCHIQKPSLINLAKFPQISKYSSTQTSFIPKTFLRNVISKNNLNSHAEDNIPVSGYSIHELLMDKSSVRSHDCTRYYSNSWSVKSSNAPIQNHSILSKVAILNQVLESPWCPRQPTSYKPFRRKHLNKSNIKHDNAKDSTINDNNNNLQSTLHTDVDRISPKPIIEVQHSTSSIASREDFKCTICDQVFSDCESLSAHSQRHSTSARYSCSECSKSFSQLRNYKYHMSIHRGTREFAATCSVCGKYFNDRGYLSSHMKIHRNRKEYKCSQCPKSFNQRVAYNMHVRIHTGIKPHVCSECGKAFSRKMLLKQHQRTHSGERPYACPHCDKRFADRSNMTLHLRLHTGIKPFSCTLCPKSFTKKHHLKSHLNFHTGAKPYSCPRCKLGFTQSSNMRTHLKKCKAPEPTITAENTLSS